MTLRYVLRYVVIPACLMVIGIFALGISLFPSERPTHLTIGFSVSYVALWVLVVIEIALAAVSIWLRIRERPAIPVWEPGQPHRRLLRGRPAWRLLGWVAPAVLVINFVLLIHFNGGVPLI